MSKAEDLAQDLEMAMRNMAIANHLEHQKTITLSHCQDCGEPIPKDRQAVKGVTRCIDCQEYEELINRNLPRHKRD